MKIWTMDGCSYNCVQLVHKLSIPDILTYHNLFSLQPQSLKKQWLLDYFQMNTQSSSETNHSVCGQPVCYQVWLSILGISQSYYYKVRSLFKSGIVKRNTQVS